MTCSYWIWAKIIENLAFIGYDNNNMYLASYDWRLSFHNLQVRDKYFSKLQAIIETSRATSDKPAVIVAHSMGKISKKKFDYALYSSIVCISRFLHVSLFPSLGPK